MKRIAIAALAALMAVSLTACGNKNKKDGTDIVKKQPTGNTTDSEDMVQEDFSSTSTKDEASDSEAAVTKPEETKKEPEVTDEPEEPEEKVDTALFKFSADKELWKVEQDENGASIIYNGDDISLAKGNCSIMINTREIEDMPERTLGEVADAIVDSKGISSSVVVNSRGESVLGGHDAYTLECVYTVRDVRFDLDITVMAEGTDVLEVWVMSYESCTNAMQSRFEDVLKTIKFTE